MNFSEHEKERAFFGTLVFAVVCLIVVGFFTSVIPEEFRVHAWIHEGGHSLACFGLGGHPHVSSFSHEVNGTNQSAMKTDCYTSGVSLSSGGKVFFFLSGILFELLFALCLMLVPVFGLLGGAYLLRIGGSVHAGSYLYDFTEVVSVDSRFAFLLDPDLFLVFYAVGFLLFGLVCWATYRFFLDSRVLKRFP